MNYVTSLTELLAVTKATIQLLAVSDTDAVAEFHRRVALRCRCDESGGGNQGDMMRGRNSEQLVDVTAWLRRRLRKFPEAGQGF